MTADSFLAELTGRGGLLTPDEVDLPEPALGEQQLRHDAEFRTVDRTFDLVRDTVNRGIDILNDLGCGLRRLPEESLEELVVLPLTGDYRRIRQNADAVAYVDAALAVDREGEEGVLVVFADAAAVGNAGPVDGAILGRDDDGVGTHG